MATFPDLKMTSFKFKSKKDIHTSEYQGGYIQTRPKNTRAVKIFNFTLSSLSKSEAEEIDAFLVETRGHSFTFIHPFNNTTHEVRLLGDLPDFIFDKSFQDFTCSELSFEEV